jgi:hypothetical protein
MSGVSGLRRKFLVVLSFFAIVLLATTLGVCVASQYWINQTVQVPAGQATYWSGTFYAGNRLQGSFSVESGDIKFYILDAANYAKYSDGQAFIARYSNQAIQVPDVDFTVPSDGKWFVLLDNSYSVLAKAVTVTLILKLNGISNNSQSGIPSDTWLILGIIAVVVVVILVLAIGKLARRKK